MVEKQKQAQVAADRAEGSIAAAAAGGLSHPRSENLVNSCLERLMVLVLLAKLWKGQHHVAL